MEQINTSNRPNKPYKLVPYNPEWKTTFEIIARSLKPVFGENLIKIEHMGSTAVPGMLAKPQIDVMVVVKDLSLVEGNYKEMSKLGFRAYGDYIKKDEPEEYFTKDDEHSIRTCSVHVMQIGNFEIEDTLRFRDYLRENQDAREAYIAQKKHLMETYSDQDYNAYGRGKIDFLEDLKAKARIWYKENHH